MSSTNRPNTLEEFVQLLQERQISVTSAEEAHDQHCFLTINGTDVDIRIGRHNIHWKVGIPPNTNTVVTSVLPTLIKALGQPDLIAVHRNSDHPVHIIWGNLAAFKRNYPDTTYKHFEPESPEFSNYLKKWGIS